MTAVSSQPGILRRVSRRLSVTPASIAPVLVLLAFALWLTRHLLFSGGIPEGNDFFGWVARIQQFAEDFEMFYIWSDWGFGLVQMPTAHIPLSLANWLIGDPALVSSLVVFFTTWIAGLTMYLLAKDLTGGRFPALIAALVYVASQYFLTRWSSGHLPFALGYAFMPLLVWLYLRILRHDSLVNPLTFTLLSWAVIAFTRPDIILYAVPLLGLITIGWYVSHRRWDQIKETTLRLVRAVAIGVVGLVALMGFQLIPMAYGATSRVVSTDISFPVAELQWWSLTFKQSMLGMAREMGALFSRGGIAWDSHPLLTQLQYELAMGVIPIMAATALLFRRNWLTFSLVAVALVGGFLAKGPNAPGQDVFLWMSNNVPLFGALKTPNRWIMLNYFSYSLLIGVAINGMMRLRDRAPIRLRDMPGMNRVLPLLEVGGTACVLALVAASLLLASWYLTTGGIRTWSPSDAEIEPYQWIAQQQGDFRIATLPYFQEYMKRDDGFWTHDLGYSSFLYSGQSVAGIGDWKTGPGYSFMSYTHQLMLDGETTRLAELLGRYDIRYFVVQGYDPTYVQSIPAGYGKDFQRRFLEKQDGLELVFDNTEAQVYENLFWRPRFSAASGYSLALGGKSALLARPGPTEGEARLPLVFVRDVQEAGSVEQVQGVAQQARLIRFHESTPADLALQFAPGTVRVRPQDFPNSTSAFYVSPYFSTADAGWYGTLESDRRGDYVVNSTTLRADIAATTETPFNAPASADYDLWVRLRFGPDRSQLAILVDRAEVARFTAAADVDLGLRWTNIGSVKLEEGSHSLQLVNEGYATQAFLLDARALEIRFPNARSNELDEIAFVPQGALSMGEEEIRNLLAGHSVRISLSGTRLMSTSTNKARLVEYLPRDPFPDSVLPLWRVIEPEKVSLERLSTEGDQPPGEALSLVMQEAPRQFATVLDAPLSPAQDWSRAEVLSMWYRGDGTGQPFSLLVYFNDSLDSWVRFTLANESTEWQQAVFLTRHPDGSEGEIDWSRVSLLRIQAPSKNLSTRIGLGEVLLGAQESRNDRGAEEAFATDFLAAVPSRATAILSGISSERESEVILLLDGREVSTLRLGGQSLVRLEPLSEGGTDDWTPAEPEIVGVSLRDKHDGQVTALTLETPRRFATVAELPFPAPVDLSASAAIRLSVRPSSPGVALGLVFYFSDSLDDFARFSLTQDRSEDGLYTLSLSDPNATSGTVDWSDIWLVRLQALPKDWLGEIDIGLLWGIGQMNTRPLQVGEATVDLGEVAPGWHDVEIKATTGMSLGRLSLDLVPASADASSAPATGQPRILSIQRHNPTRYSVEVDVSEPFFLVFSESYHPLWRAIVDGEEVAPIQTDSFVNGYWIDKTGKYTVTVEFTGQRAAVAGYAVSGVALLLVVGLLVMLWRRGRRFTGTD